VKRARTRTPPSTRAAASAAPTRVVLAKNLARSIRRGHPWIFRDALRTPPALPDGALVTVTAPDGQPLAHGFWDARSAIAVRVLEAAGGRQEAASGFDGDAQVVEARVAAAIDRRLGDRVDGARLAEQSPSREGPGTRRGFPALIDREQTDAFRLIHGEADRLPGIHADLYRDAISIRFDGDGARAFYLERADLPARLGAAAGARGIAVTSVIERGKRGEGEVARALAGALPPTEIEVRENGLRFGVDLAHGQKGGLFLDQRDNRARVRALARGRRVLNLFGYTGGFSIYAAAGGASHTTTVDVAREAIQSARRNFERNHLPLEAAELHAADAFAFLERIIGDRISYDLVISDPPSFAPNRKALPAALGAYRRLHRLCATVTAPGGIFCAASCSSHVDAAAFERTIVDGAADAGRRFALDEMHGAAADHPVAPFFPEGSYLKFAIGRL
jgi:23S rRNA (cytosine1962-C5)-methyltransferase